MIEIRLYTRGPVSAPDIRAPTTLAKKGLKTTTSIHVPSHHTAASHFQYGYECTSSSLSTTSPPSTCSRCFPSKYSSNTSSYNSFPLYLLTSSPQLRTALAKRPGTYGSLQISVIGSKYVRIVNTTPPDLGRRRRDCRSERK